MKRQALLLLSVIGLVSLLIVGQVHSDTLTVRRVRLQASNTCIVAAVGTEGVGGAGTDLDAGAEGSYCDIHFDKVRIDEDRTTAVLIGKVVDAADPVNLGAFVKITAHTNGKVNFVFQNLPPNTSLGTGPAGIDFTGGTVSIVNIF